MLSAVALGVAAAIWRYYDGSNERWKHSNVYIIGIILACMANATWGTFGFNPHSLFVGLCGLLTLHLMTRGMPGWTYWDQNPKGIGMGPAFALPTALVGAIGLGAIGPSSGIFAFSGMIIAATYVLGSKLKNPPLMEAEKWGRLSYGFVPFGLALI